MILKKKKQYNWLYLVMILLVLIISFIYYELKNNNINLISNPSKYKIELEKRASKLLDKFIFTNDFGFSTWYDLKENTPYGKRKFSIYEKVDLLFKNGKNIWKYKIDDLEYVPKIDSIKIDIKFKHLKEVLKDRKKALENKILVNPTEVPANIFYKGKLYKVKLRLKGDLFDHWDKEYALSFRIKVKNDKYILGFNEFSLQKPSSRQHPYNQTYQDLARSVNLLSPVDKYVRVNVNGENWGIMNVEEHMTKILLEKQNKKESLIIKFGDEKKWLYNKVAKSRYKYYRLSDKNLNVNAYKQKKYINKDTKYRYWLSYISSERVKKNHVDLYDINAYSKSLMLASLWNFGHTLASSNMRNYFNPYTLKLEPITTDQAFFQSIKKYGFFKDYNPIQEDTIFKQIVASNQFQENKERYINMVEKVLPKIDKTFSYYSSIFPLDMKKDMKKSISLINENLKNIKYFKGNFFTLDNNYSNEEKILPPSLDQIKELYDFIYAKHYTDGSIEIFNLLPIELKLKEIKVNNTKINIMGNRIKPYTKNEYRPFRINTNLVGIYDNKIEITVLYKGIERKYKIPISYVGIKEYYNPLSKEVVPRFIEKIDKLNYKLSKGNYIIKKPIILDGNLIIEKGSTLKFSRESYLIIKGALNINGTEEEPVLFLPIEKNWKGLYVLGKNRKSNLKYVVFKDTKALEDSLLKLTGAITFYRTKLKLENVKFINTKAEDALNTVESFVNLKNIEIRNTISDGYDSDFSFGNIENIYLNNIKGDALDFSGSKINIRNANLTNIKDKAISAGERSLIQINDSRINNSGVGLSSKDASKLLANNVDIKNSKFKDGMSYIKKGFYLYPNLIVNNSKILKKDNYLSQTGCDIFLNKEKLDSIELNVEELYKTDIMRKNDRRKTLRN